VKDGDELLKIAKSKNLYIGEVLFYFLKAKKFFPKKCLTADPFFN